MKRGLTAITRECKLKPQIPCHFHQFGKLKFYFLPRESRGAHTIVVMCKTGRVTLETIFDFLNKRKDFIQEKLLFICPRRYAQESSQATMFVMDKNLPKTWIGS